MASSFGGDWVDQASNGACFDVTNPATSEVIATLPDFGRYEAGRAIGRADQGQKIWAARTGKDRGGVLRKWHVLILAHGDDLAVILTT
jgi:succinate-semialdehyde dehydrogenase / glutarate-semialdehyde dehydrogenase